MDFLLNVQKYAEIKYMRQKQSLHNSNKLESQYLSMQCCSPDCGEASPSLSSIVCFFFLGNTGSIPTHSFVSTRNIT